AISQKLTEIMHEVVSKIKGKEEAFKRGDLLFEQAYQFLIQGNDIVQALDSALEHIRYSLNRSDVVFQLFTKVIQQAQRSGLKNYIQEIMNIAMQHGKALLMQPLQTQKALDPFNTNPGVPFLDKAVEYAQIIEDETLPLQIANIYLNFAHNLYSNFNVVEDVGKVLLKANRIVYGIDSDVLKSIEELSTKIGYDLLNNNNIPTSRTFLGLSREILKNRKNNEELYSFYSKILLTLISIKEWDYATETLSEMSPYLQKSDPNQIFDLIQFIQAQKNQYFRNNDYHSSLNALYLLIDLMKKLNKNSDAANLAVQEAKLFASKNKRSAVNLLERAITIYNEQKETMRLADALMTGGEMLINGGIEPLPLETRSSIQKYFQMAQKAYSKALTELGAEKDDKAIDTITSFLIRTENLIKHKFYEEAAQFASNGLDKLNQWGAKDLVIKHAFILGKEFVYENELEKGKYLLFSSIKVQKELESPPEALTNALLEIARILAVKKDYDESIALYEETFSILESSNPEKIIETIEGILEFSESLTPSNFRAAWLFFWKSIDFLRILKEYDQILRLLRQKGQNLFTEKKFSESLECFRKAFALLFELEDLNGIVDVATQCIELSEESHNKNYLDIAPEYQTLAFAKCTEANLKEAEGDLHYLIAKRSFENLRLERSRSAIAEAGKCYSKSIPSKAIDLAEEIIKEGLEITDKGFSSLTSGISIYGISLIDIAVEILVREEANSKAGDALYELGSLLLQKDRFSEAIDKYRHAMDLYSKIPDRKDKIAEIGDKLVQHAERLTQNEEFELADQLFSLSRGVYQQIGTTASEKTTEIQQLYTDTVLDQILDLDFGKLRLEEQKKRKRKPKR
ncbi:MAG: hypothetical protein ACFFBD_11100, partial [Candidatus Hodarchaeota archaeon]